MFKTGGPNKEVKLTDSEKKVQESSLLLLYKELVATVLTGNLNLLKE